MGLNNFLSELKNSANSKEKSVLDYVKNDIIKITPLNNEINIEKYKNDFFSLKEKLSFLQATNERLCRMRINEFVMSFEENIQVIMSLANFYEQKSIFEIEKEKNSILEIVNSDNIDSYMKLNIISNKLDNMRDLISKIFDEIISKIKNYEELSEKKIARAKNSFYLNIKKFLQ